MVGGPCVRHRGKLDFCHFTWPLDVVPSVVFVFSGENISGPCAQPSAKGKMQLRDTAFSKPRAQTAAQAYGV